MKHGKKLTRRQKEIVQDLGLNPDDWLLIKNLPDKLVIFNKQKGTLAELELFEGQVI